MRDSFSKPVRGFSSLMSYLCLLNKPEYNNLEQNDLFESGNALPIVEEFYSLQGEGYHTGKPAYFIRIGGCDVCCSWCDVKVSWDPKIHPTGTIEQIIAKATSYPAKAVVVTGGEPFIYDLTLLCAELKSKGFDTFVETSGSHPITGQWDWICISPKKNKAPLNDSLKHADELKVIIDKKLDFKWAEQNAAKVPESCRLYLQPEWSVYNEIVEDVVEYIKNHPQWNISLQAHKFMHIP